MHRIFKNDLITLGLAVALTLAGILSIVSSEGGFSAGMPPLAFKQLVFLIMAICSYAVFSFIPVRSYARIAPVIYALSIIILIAVLVFGAVKGGSQRWFIIGNLQVQPSEMAKVFMIIVLARIFTRLKGEIPDRANFILALLSLFPVIILIAIEPDLGTAMIFFLIFLVMSFASPINWRIPVTFILIVVLLVPTIWPLMRDYQKDRIISFINPSSDLLGKGYQSNQSKIAIGSGGFTGWGLFKGPQNKLNFIPSQTTDFIFSIVGEEGGFVFSVLIVLFYLGIFIRLGLISARAPDPFGSLIILGICSMLFLQTFVNIGMTMGIMPVTGLPLPFMSYGGSSLLINFTSLGIANSVYKFSDFKKAKSKSEIWNVRFTDSFP